MEKIKIINYIIAVLVGKPGRNRIIYRYGKV